MTLPSQGPRLSRSRPGEGISATLGSTLVERGAHSEALLQQLFGLLEQEYSSEDWYSLAMELSHLASNNMSPDAFKAFQKVRYYTKGSVLEAVDAETITNEQLLMLDVDLLIPAALENQITAENVGDAFGTSTRSMPRQ